MNTNSLLRRRDNIFYLVLFLVVLAFLIIISLIIRSVVLVKNSTFTLNSFTVLILADKPYIVSVDRNLHQLSEVTWNESRNSFIHNTPFVNSLRLGVPLDGEIIQPESDSYSSNFLLQYYTFPNIARIIVTNSDLHFIGMDPFDFLKIYLSTKGVPNTNINQTHLSPDSNGLNTTLNSYFKDETIINEEVSVEVVNDTDVSGLGSSVAQMLENGGYNIISVVSGNTAPHSTIMYRIPPNTTIKHLLHVVPFPATYHNETAIADITVNIGEDYASLR